MNLELRYFTGTGNSLKIINTCYNSFNEAGYQTHLSAISLRETSIPYSDLLGFCFPVYAFGIPRICRNYLKGIKRFKKQQKAFVLITAGAIDEAGFSIKECERILNKKNCEIIYSDVIQMPINWTTSPKPPFPPTKDEALEIIEKGVEKSKGIVEDIMAGIKNQHTFNYPKRYSKLKLHWEYFLFKNLGVQNMWRLFNTYDSCNGCQICAKICPTNSITMMHNKPVWSKTCEQCMRCVNFCPKESIYQSNGGETKDKNKYHEPGFKPLKLTT